jgi:hypothetical protein
MQICGGTHHKGSPRGHGGRDTKKGLLRQRKLKNVVIRPGNTHAGLGITRFIYYW